ncbi:MAG TPA: hypothetical protein PLR90_07775 [Methylophilus sp.]|nr:hypothetical protein [Methylophilus sp.]HQQ33802.1 hypothetical protein [Methylophilus sp.]
MGILRKLAKTAVKEVALVVAVLVGKKVITKIMNKKSPVQETKEVEVMVDEAKVQPPPATRPAAKPKVAKKSPSGQHKSAAKPKTSKTVAVAEQKVPAKAKAPAKPKAVKVPKKAAESSAEAPKPEASAG